jgi:protein-S-isoprenylcysteine O-methyltransferase Ste14
VPTAYLEDASWARLVFGLGLGAFLLGEASQALKGRRGAAVADVRSEVAFRILFVAAVLLLPVSRALVPAAVLPGPGWFVVGAVVGWCGLLLRWWSIATLGPLFTVVLRTSSDQVVVDRGPYRVLRHPSYTGLLAVFLGGGLAFGTWVGAVGASALLLVGLVWRIRLEERALTEALGEAYVEFARGRARLVPHVW